MKTLVTGATGFVGAAVARRLLAAGHTLRVLVRKNSDLRNLEGVDVETVVGDLRDPGSLRAAVSGCRALFHVAADYRLWARDSAELYASNVDGTVNLMRAALRADVERIVYTSSVATLGLNADGTPSDEETPVRLEDMIGDYKRSKFLAEETVRQMVIEDELPAIIVNPSTPIGPRDVKPTPTGRIILDAAAGRLPAFVDTGLNVVHVDDVAAGHLSALERGKVGERYVLGGEDMSLEAILIHVAKVSRGKPPRVRLPHAVVMPIALVSEAWARIFGGEPLATVDGVRMSRKRMFYSSRKAKEALGYTHRPAPEAIHDAVDWFVRNNYLR
ncbi:MAG: NAD-dependent epimerase/dehydratase family protein [Gammaproteobacteria bacterium]|nr:NAD-dependent epimerase/dehydratase family protein [Gammaproteobacteria bacterium]MDH3411250.1 NAD-dependent epimerase/dehydratase family protein [Gammaproteobacteria bacterium]